MKTEIINTSNASDIIFPVREESSFDAFGMPANSDYSKAIIGTINGQDKILNVASDRYKLISVETIIMLVKTLLTDADINFTENYEMRNNSVFSLNFVVESKNIRDSNGNITGTKDLGFSIGADNDKCFYRISINTSYNGLVKYSFMVGLYRMICSNGMVIPFQGKEANEYNVEFVGKHTEKFSLALESMLGNISDSLQKMTENQIIKRLDVLNTPILNWVERLETVMTANKISIGNKKKDGSINKTKLDEVASIVRTESEQNNLEKTDWLIYNAINNYIYDNDSNVMSPEVRNNLDKQVLEYMLETAN
jgi:hypothetical protein